MALTYKIADTADILFYNNPYMRIGDLLVSGYNSGADTSIIISTSQANLISDIVGFDPTFPDRSIFFMESQYGYIHLFDAGLDGGSTRNLKIRPLNYSEILSSIQPTIDRQFHIQGVKNFDIDGHTVGHLGHLYGMDKFLRTKYGWRLDKTGTTVSCVGIKIDDGNTGWGITGVELDGGGYQYSAISTHHKDDPSVDFANIHIRYNYIHDHRGEHQYHGSNVADNNQHSYINVEIDHNIMVRGGLELFQLQHANTKIHFHHNISVYSAQDRENTFQKFQDRNNQFQNIESGQILVEDSIFIGGGETIFVTQYFNSWAGTPVNKDVIYNNCYFGYPNDYFGYFGNGNTITGTQVNACYFKTGRSTYRYDQLHFNEVAKSYALLFQNSDVVVLKDNKYDTTNLKSGTGTFVESGNVQGTVEDIQFLFDPVRSKIPGYDHSYTRYWNIEKFASTVGGDSAFDQMTQGEPVIYEQGDVIFHKGRMLIATQRHTPSNTPEIDGFYSNIAALTADQGNQTTGQWYRVNDASADPDITGNKRNYYKYLGTTVGDLSDYEPIIAGYYADTTALIADQGNQVTGKKYKAGTGEDAFYVYKGTTVGDLTDYDQTLGGLSTTIVTNNGNTRTVDFDSSKQPDVDIDFDTAVADSNGETVGTYWKLVWFDNAGTWTQEIPDGGYALADGSTFEQLDMGIKSAAQYQAKYKPDHLKLYRYFDNAGSPDLTTELEIIGIKIPTYTPPTRAELGTDAWYAFKKKVRDVEGRQGVETLVNNEYILIN